MWLLREISLPYVSRHRARTLLTIVGIATGIAAIAATQSVTEAIFRSFRTTVEATAGRAEIHVSNGSAGVPETLIEAIAKSDGVAAASALVEGFVPFAAAQGDVLAIFGFDLLGDTEHEAQLPRRAVEIPDELEFVSQADSAVIPRGLASARQLSLGDGIEVLTPRGPRRLTVRGLVDTTGPAALFGGMVALMDLPAAQRLLAKEGRVDRIDVRLKAGVTPAAMVSSLSALVGDRAQIEESPVYGAKAQDLLFSLRVALQLAGLLAVVVGFCIIYHTVKISVLQRRREIALLGALGVAGHAVFAWLIAEAALLAAVACAIGIPTGIVLARAAMSTFGAVATAWIRLPPEPPSLTPETAALAALIGFGVTLTATSIPVARSLAEPKATALHFAARGAAMGTVLRRSLLASLVCALLTAILLGAAPRSLSYTWLVAYVFAVNSLALSAFALVSPIFVSGLGEAVRLAADRSGRLSSLIAGAHVSRHPSAPVAVVAAIVVALGWILADGSLIASMRGSWLRWLDEHYQSDLVLTAGGPAVSLLTYPPFDGAVAEALRGVANVEEVQAIRTVEARLDGRPIVLQAIDRARRGLPMIDTPWSEVEAALFDARGVVVTENLAYKAALEKGDRITLTTPEGPRTYPVLGVYADFQGAGDLGGVVIARQHYAAVWKDDLVTRLRVWVAAGADLESVRAEVQRRFGSTYGIHAMTFAEARRAVAELVEAAFALTYALIFIALLVSFVGVTNFLLAAILGRGEELRTLDALGVDRRQVGAAIIGEGVLLGTTGAVLGIAAGLVVSRIIVQHSVPMVNGWHFQLEFAATSAAALGIGAVGLAALAGVWPARLATRRRFTDAEASP